MNTPRRQADPLLSAAGLAIAPIAVSGLAAALAPERTVGSVVIALLVAVIVYLGGVVATLRFGAHVPPLAGHPAGREVAAMSCKPVLLSGVIGAALSGYAALAVISMGALWAYRVGLAGARDRLGLPERDRRRSAALCALLAGGPAATRALLYVL